MEVVYTCDGEMVFVRSPVPEQAAKILMQAGARNRGREWVIELEKWDTTARLLNYYFTLREPSTRGRSWDSVYPPRTYVDRYEADADRQIDRMLLNTTDPEKARKLMDILYAYQIVYERDFENLSYAEKSRMCRAMKRVLEADKEGSDSAETAAGKP